jgi:hypothetical protein
MTAVSTRPRLRSHTEHGSETAYGRGCRCDLCRAAHAACARDRRSSPPVQISAMSPEERAALLQRLMQRVRVDETTGCWIWMKRPSGGGYGRIYVGGRYPVAHRVAYELLVGPIPEGLELDHLCHNRDPHCFADKQCVHLRCVNPDHLEPVTPQVNTLRGKTPAARAKARTVCVNGHPLTGDNVYIKTSGHRGCRACQRVASAKWSAENKERRNAVRRAWWAKRPQQPSTPEQRKYKREWERRRRAALREAREES